MLFWTTVLQCTLITIIIIIIIVIVIIIIIQFGRPYMVASNTPRKFRGVGN